MLEKIKNIKFGNVVFSALFAALGLCFLTFSSSVVTLTVVIGILVAAFGGVALALTISKSQGDRTSVIKMVIYSAVILLGILTAIFNDKFFGALIFALSLLIAIGGAFKLKLSLSCKKHGISGWWIIAIASAAIVISVFALSSFTPNSKTVASAWLGVSLIALAALNIASTTWSAKCKTAEKAELYYEVYRDIKDSGKK